MSKKNHFLDSADMLLVPNSLNIAYQFCEPELASEIKDEDRNSLLERAENLERWAFQMRNLVEAMDVTNHFHSKKAVLN